MNNVFDLLNCRNKLCKGDYAFPINEETVFKAKQFLEQFKLYIEGLKFEPLTTNSEGELVLKSQRKTGFLGLIICLTNTINLFEELQKERMSFLLTYKLSQDHIEIFFSAMRSRGGFNNNPNVIQFRSAYKRLLVRHNIEGSVYANCSPLDTSNILYVSASKRTDADAIYTEIDVEEQILFDEFDHDYNCYHMPELEEYVVDVVHYTSGFIVRKIQKNKALCKTCDSFLTVDDNNNQNSSKLFQLKNRGKLINVSSDVHKTCLVTEYIIRICNEDLLRKKNIKLILSLKALNELSSDNTIFNSKEIKEHILQQDLLDNHRSQLLKLIVDCYITLRLHHFAKSHTFAISGRNIRHNYTKQILFHNQ